MAAAVLAEATGRSDRKVDRKVDRNIDRNSHRKEATKPRLMTVPQGETKPTGPDFYTPPGRDCHSRHLGKGAHPHCVVAHKARWFPNSWPLALRCERTQSAMTLAQSS